jgi:outer membrane protein TolC
LLGFPEFVLAQESASAPGIVELTLQKAEDLALAGNPHIRAADDRAYAAGKRVLPALMPGDPSFMYDNSTPGMEQLMVEENLGFPGKGIAQADALGAEAKKAQAMAADTRLSIVLQARQAFWEFYYRQKVDAVLQEAQVRWKSLGQIVQSKELSGQWLSIKDIRMQMESAKAVNDLVTNSRALRVSQYNLNHLFSLPHRTAYKLGSEVVFSEPPSDEEGLVREALEHNPGITVYRRAVEAQDARHSSAALDHLPDFNVRLVETKDPASGQFSEFGFRLGLTVPLFFPAKQTQALDASSDELLAARYDLKGEQDLVVHMVEDSYVNADSAWRILKLYQEGGLLKQTQRAWSATQLAYRNEQMSLSDFVETYNTYLETLTNYYQAQADYGKALAELEYQTGVLKGDTHEKF